MALVVMASPQPLGRLLSTSLVAKPFKVRGADVPVQQGPVLLLNGDQPLIQLKEQLTETTSQSTIRPSFRPTGSFNVMPSSSS